MRKPSALPLDVYEDKLAAFLRNFCHRDEASGWKSDKRVRDTGPFIGSFHNGKWTGNYHGTHAPVVTWYSPDMVAWLEANRPEGHEAARAPGEPAPVPDGAIMVKEMFPPPVSRCADVDTLKLCPAQRRGGDGARRPRLVSTAGSGAGSAGARGAGRRTGRRTPGQRLSEHGLRPVLHELP